MKNENEISAKVFLELIARKGVETDNTIDELFELARGHGVSDIVELEGVVEHIYGRDNTSIYISVLLLPTLQQSTSALMFIKSIFEQLFSYYPKYTEPL
jgi:hypothetical protein